MVHLLSPETSLLLVVDVQEKFRPVIFNADEMITNTRRLIEGCRLLDVPVLFTEQYPKGLGHTVPELIDSAGEQASTLEKTSFGCCGDTDILSTIRNTFRQNIMVCGIEAHVCVNQTVTELLNLGYTVHLVEDTIGSRHEANYHIGLKKMHQAGAFSSCVEMALFELMATAKHPRFKAIQQLVK